MCNKALVIGATGATGSTLVAQLLDNEQIWRGAYFCSAKSGAQKPQTSSTCGEF